MNNALRIGNFTSSEIAALMVMGKREMTEEELKNRPKKGAGSKTTQVIDINSLGDAALTYIEECNMERRLGRSLTDECNARPLAWGKLVERRVHNLLGLDYKLCSQETIQHPTISCWAGSPDFIRYYNEGDAVGDAKCPITLKSFCQLVDAWNKGGIKQVRKDHKDGEKYYWQLVSNACILGVPYGELIVYAPYKNELEEIKKLAEGDSRYYWIWSASDDELPYLHEGGHYKNLNVMGFLIPEEDKKLLTERVQLASKHLINTNNKPHLACHTSQY